MSSGFPQTGFDPLQRRDAFAFEVSFSRSSEDRLGSKAVLNPKGILHDPSQPAVLNFSHVSKITNESPNRKLKNPGRLKQRHTSAQTPIMVGQTCWFAKILSPAGAAMLAEPCRGRTRKNIALLVLGEGWAARQRQPYRDVGLR
jgi:hypothetical protein